MQPAADIDAWLDPIDAQGALLMDFNLLDQALLAQADALLPMWLPNGVQRGREWCVGNINGDPGESLKINMQTGVWCEFADGTKGPGLTSLYAAITHQQIKAAADELAPKVGHTVNGSRPARIAAYRKINPETDPLILVPDYASRQPIAFRHPTYKIPDVLYPYPDAQGRLLLMVARHDIDDKTKQVIPWRWIDEHWRMKAPPVPTPLFGLDLLAAMPEPRVIITEGEKACCAARAAFTKNPCISWFGGTARVLHADWEPVYRRKVLLWPDADESGRRAMTLLAERLVANDCDIEVIELDGKLPKGFDCADVPLEERLGWVKTRRRPLPRKPVEPAPERAPMDRAAVTERMPVTIEPAHEVIEGPGYGVPQSLAAQWKVMNLPQTNRGPRSNLDCVQRVVDYRIALGEDAPLKLKRIYYDEFLNRVMFGSLEWTEADTLALTTYMQRDLGIHDAKPGTVHDGVMAHAQAHRRHCLREWLQSLTWDGKERAHKLLSMGFGTINDEYHQAVGQRFLRAMCARIQTPGCQSDHVLVLEGAQGIQKSSALRILAHPYFSELHEAIGSTRWLECIQGVWLGELSELNSMARSEIERVKAAISNRSDRFRPAYGRLAVDIPRQLTLAGSTNADQWLSDPTGGRRFWPVRCGKINLDWLTANREQLLAEAWQDVLNGRDWWQVPEGRAREEQAERYEDDPWSARVMEYASSRDFVTALEVLEHIGFTADRIDMRAQRRVANVLRPAGWYRTVRHGIRGWRPMVKDPPVPTAAPAADPLEF